MFFLHRDARLPVLLSAMTALGVLAGCGSPPPPAASSTPLAAEGTLGPATGPGPARTYDPALAPEGAFVRAELTPLAGGTRAALTVRGLLPNRGYAAHAHLNRCGPTGQAAGGHFQERPDPKVTDVRPSVDPAYANPTNELWLDVRTDANGTGTTTTVVPIQIAFRGPTSIVLHEAMATMSAPGVAGTAGDRVACLTVDDTAPVP